MFTIDSRNATKRILYEATQAHGNHTCLLVVTMETPGVTVSASASIRELR